MGIKTTYKPYRAMLVSVHKRISILQTVYGAPTKAAVIGMAMARLEGGFGCSRCGAWIGDKPVDPPKIDSKEWDELAEYHADACDWISTKGFQIK